ncbi:hypothetical protein BDY19DRAFT_153065 [Irpex rosettiformis]|uniref:Uncharacterized protein n=1 Tax=Irpex rosettiformis TaxID=378272 RepID=A0ACB8U3G1_9APHY|nr:hypothetical protein BDY19DRAFT_153065 [Irpex rosettiformis]
MHLLQPWNILFYLLAAPILFALGQSKPDLPSGNDSQLVCVPFGTCEPCPEDALNEPFCQPFGNRRLMHCTPASSSSPSSFAQSHSGSNRSPQNANPNSNFQQTPSLPSGHVGEIPAWESCGRIVEKERGDFYEFLACNFCVALIAIGVVLFRSKQLKAMQARQLAARIGLTRRIPGGWVG